MVMETITVAPRYVFWLPGSGALTESDKFEFLRKDLFIFDTKMDYLRLAPVLMNDGSVLVLDFDAFLHLQKPASITGVYLRAKQLCELASPFRDRVFIYSRLVNSTLASIFETAGIRWFESDLSHRTPAVAFLNETLFPLLTATDTRKFRESLRLQLSPEARIGVAVRSLHGGTVPPATGILKDISLRGLGMKISGASGYQKLLGEFVTVVCRSVSRGSHLNFTARSALVNRFDPVAGELGLSFHIDDPIFMDRHNADQLSRFISQSLGRITGNRLEREGRVAKKS